ncbi:hypothetical protein GM658_12655 [Pseudoduganella eburnea]|uniref:Uncharacterized protein n=1 Tax=Massilia eburnea TaxID=1776165 RepID=A0A6L6QG41_9BURK|nr:hypothetical protein [Massilia eburnea]MTW11448.1 hypothetical protein [Massilia eburnea]
MFIIIFDCHSGLLARRFSGIYTVCMYSIVRQLRKNGVRRHDRDFASDPGASGMLNLIYLGAHPRLSIERWGDQSQANSLLPSLFDAHCVSWQGMLMLWRGYQREHDKAPTYLQEWHVTLLKERPERGDVGDFMTMSGVGAVSRAGKI